MKKICLLALSVFWFGSTTVFGQMTSNEVLTILTQAVTRAVRVATNSVIAVADREGFVLGVWSLNTDTNSFAFALDLEDAIAKAGTAAYLSSDENAFTSRTAGFIVQQNFPPGVKNKPTGPLVGVNFSSLSFSDVNRFKNPHTYMANQFGGSGTNGAPIAGPNAVGFSTNGVEAISGLAGSPGGVPLFRNGKLIGGVGVAGTKTRPRRTFVPGTTISIPALDDIQVTQVRDIDEDVALAGQIGFAPKALIQGSHVTIDGIRVPYVRSTTQLNRNQLIPLGQRGFEVAPYFITNSPLVNYPLTNILGITGELRAVIIDDPISGQISNVNRLNATEVTRILGLVAQRARITRAGIRLPRGRPAQVFISVINNPNMDSNAPTILGTFRTPDATVFSWDVSVQKARTALFFSDETRAFSSRTVGFLGQRYYPPGIVVTSPGPLWGLQEKFSLLPAGITNPLNAVVLTGLPPGMAYPINPNLPNSITIFPGGFPLYRNGVLIGAVGVSGDGVDQDDIISVSGTVDFLPPEDIRADHLQVRGIRLPYAKFPRNPSL